MQDKIKIVYNWIGPRSPIWNTELPNILSFADATEHAAVNSHLWWKDDTWTSLFRNAKDQYEIYPACGIDGEEDDRHFIYPFSLTWRIEFGNYFAGATGLLEFSHTPGHITHYVRNRNGYFLINHSVEAFMNAGYLHAMHGYFKNIHGIPLHKIIYLTGCINAQEIYDSYCEQHGIPDNKNERLTIVAYPSSKTIFKPNIEQDIDTPDYDVNIVPEKLFLVWNRRFREHRTALCLMLEELGLVDRSYVSCSQSHIERPNYTFHDACKSSRLWMIYPYFNDEIVQRFANRLPLVIDGETDINQMCEDRENRSRPFYQNSLVSIITETHFDEPEVTLTEKSFKPIKEKHPFIIVGAKGAIKGMHDAGFKTFSDFWDESYDNIQHHNQRLEAIKNILHDISTWDHNKILEFRRNVKPILDHNYNVLKNSSPREMVLKLADIVRGNQ